MPCRQVSTYNGSPGAGKPTGGGYVTEAECNQACKEGACCAGTGCSVKPKCQCQSAGQLFNGVGTTCATTDCCCTEAKRWQVVFFNRPVNSAIGCGCDKLDAPPGTVGTATYYTTLSDGSEVCITKRNCGQFATLAECKDYGANIVGSRIGLTLVCTGSPTVPWGRTIGYDAGPEGIGYPTQFDCVQCTPNPLP